MRKTVLIGWLVLWAATATAATALSDAEKHRLSAYLSFITVTAPKSPVDESYKAGDTCGACGGRGSVGDGVIESPCDFVTPDGLLACKGTGKLQSTGGQMDVCEVGCALCESVCDCGNCDGNCGGGCCDNCKCPTPERDELFDNLEDAPARFNESYVRDLEYDLQKALEEVQTLKATCPDCPTCADPQPEESQEETQPVEEPSSLTDLSQTQWNWQGTSNVPISEMRRHLTDEHSIDSASLDKMSREELIALHNLLHNEEVRASTPQAKSKTKTYSSGGCPGGNCPTGPSRSYSRGLFGRWR